MFMDPILEPFLNIAPIWSIIIISFVLSIFITLVYKFMTNQELMKQMKDDIKNSQKRAKELKNEPQHAMAVQKKAMETNMKYMMHSFKPMLITFIPLILIFGWLNAHYGVEAINPNEYFTITLSFDEAEQGSVELLSQEGIEVTGSATKEIIDGKAQWELKAAEGEYLLDFRHNDRTYTKRIITTEKQVYTQPTEKISGNAVKEIKTGQEKLVLLTLFGWKLGWLITYIIFSLIFTLAVRKVLKVH